VIKMAKIKVVRVSEIFDDEVKHDRK